MRSGSKSGTGQHEKMRATTESSKEVEVAFSCSATDSVPVSS